MQEERKTQSPYNDAYSAETSLYCVMPMRKDASSQGCGRNTVVRSPHPRQRARKIVKSAEGTLPAALRAAAHHLGAEKASFGLPRASEGASSRHCDQLVLLQAAAGCPVPSSVTQSRLETTVWLPRSRDVRAKRRQHL